MTRNATIPMWGEPDAHLNGKLTEAKAVKLDEFYTEFVDIEREILAYVDFNPDVFRGKTILLPCDDPEWSNFTKFFALKFDDFGLKRLISTSYNRDGRGKVFTLDHDDNGDGRSNMDDLKWEWLKGSGDFRSPEVRALRDEADFVITNPPFSLFREFLAWIVEADKQFLILGNINAITYKESFPLIEANKMWLGPTISSGDRWFRIPTRAVDKNKFTGEIRKDEEGNDVYYQRVMGVRWFTSIDHGRRHQPLRLMTTAENLRFNKMFAGRTGYSKYDNYDAIEVSRVIAIPSDYTGIMGVPISFLDKYNPEQFEILGCSYDYGRPAEWDASVNMAPIVDGKNIYKRIFIKHRNPAQTSATAA